jgi:guanylate kinase
MNFVDKEIFEEKIKNGEFLEYFEVTGNLYGTPKQPLEELLNAGKNVVLRKEYQGALVIRKAMPEAVTVFLVPDDMQILEARIRRRATDNEEEIEKRLELAKKELSHQSEFDHVIVNPEGHPEKALADIKKVLGI